MRRNSQIKNVNTDPEDIAESNFLDDLVGVNKIFDIFSSNVELSPADAAKFFVNVLLNGHNCQLEVDSGSAFTLLPRCEFDKLKFLGEVKVTDVRFRSYTHGVFKPLGYAILPVEYKDVKSNELVFIVPDNLSPILGRVWIRRLNINLKNIDGSNTKFRSNANVNCVNMSPASIMEEFADIFEQKVGCIPNFKCSLKLRQNAKPVFIKARDVPFALRDQVEKELDELVADNIIYKVEHSDWGSPLVPIPKSNDRVRLAVDYKVAVNKQLQDAHYPIPRVEDILNTLHGANVFCTLDLYKAYLHVQVDEESQIIQTMSTHRGTFAMRRLSFGIKTAPAEFHRILDQILSGLGELRPTLTMSLFLGLLWKNVKSTSSTASRDSGNMTFTSTEKNASSSSHRFHTWAT
ncbi:Hypothetical Protein NTJ_14160 [Nesidiocoris tenuis]|uniref:Reverse transcriptase domain-containing protein n=1 Tax=Nesidiocoris tenuis TaxID=355587 RepID=A0ABN7BAK4_9HEMI|nr:Hypothetical Protein NTJ_14160 [Nesidiocoris tenuis]